jgi:hypothetical protein
VDLFSDGADIDAELHELLSAQSGSAPGPCPCQCRCRRWWRGGLLDALERHSVWRDGFDQPQAPAGSPLRHGERLTVLRLADGMLTLVGALVDALDDRHAQRP